MYRTTPTAARCHTRYGPGIQHVGHIGIVACSAEGAALCYREIAHHGEARLGRDHHPRVTLDSISLARWMVAFDAGDLDGLAAIMLESAGLLAAAGADLAICPDNSAHIAWAGVEAASPIPWLHIARVVGAEAQRLGCRRVGVLGTRFTMGGPVYPEALGALGIEAVAPTGDDAELVDRVIFEELVPGIVSAESRRAYQGVIEGLVAGGCDAVALACTEIPLLIGPEDSPLPTLDSTRLLARAAVDAAIREPST
jgi:aspartate racemase